jgi:hypothetical protein
MQALIRFLKRPLILLSAFTPCGHRKRLLTSFDVETPRPPSRALEGAKDPPEPQIDRLVASVIAYPALRAHRPSASF